MTFNKYIVQVGDYLCMEGFEHILLEVIDITPKVIVVTHGEEIWRLPLEMPLESYPWHEIVVREEKDQSLVI